MFRKIGLCLLLAAHTMMMRADAFVSALDENIRYVGRVSMASGQYARFGYPGVQIRAVFQGSSLKMKMKPNSGYYMVEMDEEKPFKIHCPEKDSVMTVMEGLVPGLHRVTVTFITEGLLHRPQFWGFLLDDDCCLPCPPQMPSHSIEFIGNSITCGFGIEGASEKERFRYSTQNQYYTFAAITARRLDAQCVVVARSGIGMYRNCRGKLLGDKEIMPAVYPYTIYGTSGEEWDFSRFTPEVVCINLGTNDTSGPSYRIDLFLSNYIQFYHMLRSHYPQAKIVLLSGTMIKAGSDRERDLNRALDQVVDAARMDGDAEVYRFDMTPEDGSLGWGSAWHPSMRRHAQMADELTAFLQKITGW